MTVATRAAHAAQPWYREPWPWLLMAGPVAPKSPNLPVAAASFVTLRPERVGFKGLASEDGVLPEVSAPDAAKFGTGDWHSLLANWESVLEGLAQAFVAGTAHVDPKRYPQTCAYCPLDGMCRVRELLVAGEETGEAVAPLGGLAARGLTVNPAIGAASLREDPLDALFKGL